MGTFKDLILGSGLMVDTSAFMWQNEQLLNILANDQASKGVWVHEKTNDYVAWFNPKWTCSTEYNTSGGGDAMLMGIRADKTRNGAWCDWSSTDPNFLSLCKALI